MRFDYHSRKSELTNEEGEEEDNYDNDTDDDNNDVDGKDDYFYTENKQVRNSTMNMYTRTY